LRTARWPGRLDQVMDTPPVILDVSHNPAGMRELAGAMERPCVVVLAIASDKDARAMIDAIDPICESLILTRFDNHRAMELDALCAACSRNYTRAESLQDAIVIAFKASHVTTPLLITGSFHTVGEAHEILERDYGARPLHF
jgi:dihydrofolate synthase/folylpolyglutamate synthase